MMRRTSKSGGVIRAVFVVVAVALLVTLYQLNKKDDSTSAISDKPKNTVLETAPRTGERQPACTIARHCHDNANHVSRNEAGACVCRCKEEFAGDSCSRCADGYTEFPSCTPTKTASQFEFKELPGKVKVACEDKCAIFDTAPFTHLVELMSVAAQMLRFQRKWELRAFAEQSLPAASDKSTLDELARGEPNPMFTLTQPKTFDVAKDAFGVEIVIINSEAGALPTYMAKQGFPVRVFDQDETNVLRLKATKAKNEISDEFMSVNGGHVADFVRENLFMSKASSIRSVAVNKLKSKFPHADSSSANSVLDQSFFNKDFILYANGHTAPELLEKFPTLVDKKSRSKLVIVSYSNLDDLTKVAKTLMGPYRALYFPAFDFPYELNWQVNSEQLLNHVQKDATPGHGYVFFVLPHSTFLIRGINNSSATVDGVAERESRHNYVREMPSTTAVIPEKRAEKPCVRKAPPANVDKCQDPRFPMFETIVSEFPNGVKLAGYPLSAGSSDLVGAHVKKYGSWEPYVEEAVGVAGMVMRNMRQKQLRGYAHYLAKKHNSKVAAAAIEAITPIDEPKLNPKVKVEPSVRSVDVEFIDIGANVGGLAYPMYSNGFRSTLFEGMPQNAQLLSTSKCLNNVRPPITEENFPCGFEPEFGDSPLNSPIRIFNRALTNQDMASECVALYFLFNRGNGMMDCSPEVVEYAKRGEIFPAYKDRGLGIGSVVKMTKIDHILSDPNLMNHDAKERHAVILAIYKLLDIPEEKEDPKKYFPSNFFHKDYVIKMDVEGFEAQILEGETWFLEQEFRPRAILAEIHRNVGYARRISTLMMKYGYIGAQLVYYEGGAEQVRLHPSVWIETVEEAIEMAVHMKKDLTNVLWVQPEFMHLVRCLPDRPAGDLSAKQPYYPCVDEEV